MKKNKIFAFLFLAIVCCGLFIGTASASRYKSMLRLKHAHLTGSTRYYTAGQNKIFIKPTSLTPMEASEYVQLKIQLTEDTGSLCILVGTRYMDMYKAMLPDQTYSENFGYLAAGDKYYYFATDHEGRDWGDIYAKEGNVLMTSNQGDKL